MLKQKAIALTRNDPLRDRLLTVIKWLAVSKFGR